MPAPLQLVEAAVMELVASNVRINVIETFDQILRVMCEPIELHRIA